MFRRLFHIHSWTGWADGKIIELSPGLNTCRTERDVMIRDCTKCGKRQYMNL